MKILIPHHVRKNYRAGQMKIQVDEYLAFCHLKRQISRFNLCQWLAKNVIIFKTKELKI